MTPLVELQQRLQSIYAIDDLPAITDFLLKAEPDAKACQLSEALLVEQHDDDEASVGVYYDPKVLARLQRESPLDDLSDESLPDLLVALEGLSHFTYLLFNARRDCAISMLELELQAEVDKFVAVWFLAEDQGYRGRRAELMRRLFRETKMLKGLSARVKERYDVATTYGLAFCERLRLFGPAHGESLQQLRNFYRLDRDAKMSCINSMQLSA